MINFDGRTMFVSSTATTGVVGEDTRLYFKQRGQRVVARYAGGRVKRGWLVGTCIGHTLRFRYAQGETDRRIHAGHSVCDVVQLPDGRLRVLEHFTWTTRDASGTNVFDELPTPK